MVPTRCEDVAHVVHEFVRELIIKWQDSVSALGE